MSTRGLSSPYGSSHLSWEHDAALCRPWLREPDSGPKPSPNSRHGHAGIFQENTTSDFDGVWKETLQAWLPECLTLFWPHIHRQIDWSVPPTFLHQELQRLLRIVKQDAKRLDLLIQLRLKTGGPALLLLHLEVEAGHIVSLAFSKRIFQYRIVLCDKYPDQPILSCAILLDRENGPEFETYVHGGYGDRLTFEFPVVNLAGWRHRVAELEAVAPTNPFAVVVLAQLECRATKPDTTRLASKLKLARALGKWDHGPGVREKVFRIIDSLLTLPQHLDDLFIETLEQSEGAAMLPQFNSIERALLRRENKAGMQQGLQQGKIEGIREGKIEGIREGKVVGASALLQTQLQRKFGTLPDWAAIRIAHADTDALQQWALNVLDAERIEDVFER